jgi:hypothetical protein
MRSNFEEGSVNSQERRVVASSGDIVRRKHGGDERVESEAKPPRHYS